MFRLALLAASLAASALPALADPYVGASVDANVNHYALICSTCPIDSGVDLAASVGGPGHASALVQEAGSGWQAAGRARIGTQALPELGASAFADVVLDPSIPKTFFYESGIFAQGLQRYDYLGSGSQSYSITYTLDGTFTLGANDAASLMSAYGGLTVYGDDYDPHAEIRGTVLASDFTEARASLAGTHAFNAGATVGFTLNPGDAIYVWAALVVTADSSHQVPGSVDAMNTLALEFTAGDVSQLAPALAPVPEPPPAALLLLGLLGLSSARMLGRRSARREARP